ncbi:MAG: hypothetical protein AAGF57_12745, partial [Pseudomonadota bacterium]
MLSAAIALVVPGFALGLSAEQQRVVDAVTLHLASSYVDPELGRKTAEKLQAALVAGELDTTTDGPRFAQALSERLQVWTGDGHLNVEYS